MNVEFEPSPDFVARVMTQVHACTDEKTSFVEWLIASRPIRYLLACGGTAFGILSAAPVF
jgi:hypothetical protein